MGIETYFVTTLIFIKIPEFVEYKISFHKLVFLMEKLEGIKSNNKNLIIYFHSLPD